ncbi:MAG: tetratricopeptide repeat protein [Desulfatiglandaceae bacterium]
MWTTFWQWFQGPDNLELTLGICIAFSLGLVLGMWKKGVNNKSPREVSVKGDTAFLKGIQYILSNDHDQAIEQFTKSVQVDSETIETYVALGNLYRSKGDIGRAIRIRQSIILRPNIESQIKLGALFDLGVDYRKGGFLNRALETFLKVAEKDTSNVETLEEIEKIYEELKDWENAYRTRQKIARLTKGSHSHILAHHLVECGKASVEKGELGRARSFLIKALSTHPDCIDAHLHLGDLYFQKQDYKKAILQWQKVGEVAPKFTFLAYRRLEGAYAKMRNLKPVETFLRESAELHPDAFTYLALARYLHNEMDWEGALRELENALRLAPSFWEARRFKGEILLSQDRNEEALDAYRELLEYLQMPYLRFQCSQCGYEPVDLQWQCPQCKKWDTIGLADSTEIDVPAILPSPSTFPEPDERNSEK